MEIWIKLSGEDGDWRAVYIEPRPMNIPDAAFDQSFPCGSGPTRLDALRRLLDGTTEEYILSLL